MSYLTLPGLQEATPTEKRLLHYKRRIVYLSARPVGRWDG